MDARFGTWNLRSLYRAGSLTALAREIANCKLGVVGVDGTEGALNQQAIICFSI
jgi:hypothetical protein